MKYEQMKAVVAAATAAREAALASLEDDSDSKRERDHRAEPRSTRRKFDHKGSQANIQRDFLGPDALFGKEFSIYFRISRPRFQAIMEDVMTNEIPFYKKTINIHDDDWASLEARLLLPLQTYAYGVPSHTFAPYFQMSPQFARDCCKQFDMAILQCYQQEYLRLPTAEDVKNITALHRSVHKVDGLLGSLDCTHTYWKNCPKGWAGSYTGKEGRPSLVLEAIADYQLFLWHIAYGFSGNLPDVTILSHSPYNR